MWMQTYTGRAVPVFDPRPEHIYIEDIAHALAFQCRFNGHTTRFYSVAEHCVVMSKQVEPELALYALLHDAAEAYTGDLIRPIRLEMDAKYDLIHTRFEDAIAKKFGLASWFTATVGIALRSADLRMLATEREQLMSPCKQEWESISGVVPFSCVLVGLQPLTAEAWFLERFQELTS